jgi:hypothetical protein
LNASQISADADRVAGAPRQLERAAQQQHADDRGAGEYGARDPGRHVQRCARVRDPDQPDPGLSDDGDDDGRRSRAEADGGRGRPVGERHRRDRQHQQQPGEDEAEAADERAPHAAGAQRGEDRHLRADGAGQQVAGGERVLELARVDPLAACDRQIAQQRDVRGRPAEAEQPDAPPLAGDCPERCVGHGPHT